jgi:hypothetical protein
MEEERLRLIASFVEEELARSKETKVEPSSQSQLISDLRDDLDALWFAFEKRIEAETLAKELTGYLKDRRDEIAVLRWYRVVATGVALFLATAVACILYVELARGLPHLKEAGDHATVAFIAGSFVFCLGIVLVVMRGVYKGLHEAETEPPYPEYVKDALALVKDLKA